MAHLKIDISLYHYTATVSLGQDSLIYVSVWLTLGMQLNPLVSTGLFTSFMLDKCSSLSLNLGQAQLQTARSSIASLICPTRRILGILVNSKGHK